MDKDYPIIQTSYNILNPVSIETPDEVFMWGANTYRLPMVITILLWEYWIVYVIGIPHILYTVTV